MSSDPPKATLAPREMLFVYGTLRSSSAHPMAAFLACHARLVARGECPGRLRRLPEFSGLVDTDAAGECVAGELWELEPPAEETLRVLDAYEGCDAGGGAMPLFERVRRSIACAEGADVEAWVYRYARAVEG